MATSTAYEIGRFLGRLRTAVELLILAAMVGIIWWTIAGPERNERASIDSFSNVYPAEPKKFEQLRDRLQAEEKKNNDLQVHQVHQVKQKELTRLKSEGASIGMSQEEVLQSMWGRPEKINRSVYRSGTREDWAYGIGNHLYFDDGRLSAIQTSGNR